MGFDAGKITGHMDLSTDEFNAKADEVEQTKEDLAKPVETEVRANTDQADEALDETKVKKDEVAKPVTFDIDADGRPAIAEAKATDEAVKAELGDPTITPKVDGAPAILEAEATGAAARVALSDAFLGAGDKAPLLSSLFGAGANTPQLLADSLRGLGWSATDAKGIISQINQDIFGSLPPGAGAQALVAAILPDEREFGRAMSQGIYSLMSGESTRIAAMYQIAGGKSVFSDVTFPIREQFQRDASLARTALGDQAQIGPGGAGGLLDILRDPFNFDGPPFTATDSGFWNGRVAPGITSSGSFGGAGSAAGDATAVLGSDESWAKQFAAQWKGLGPKAVADAQASIFGALSRGELGPSSPWATIFSGKSGIADDISKAAKKMGVDVGKDFTDAMSKGAVDAAKEAASFGGDGGGIIGKILGGLSGGAQSAVGAAGSAWSSLSGMSTGLSSAIVAAPLIVPVLGAVGLAAGGATAGTAIGTAGLLAGLLPGGLDLVHGYEAYSAQKAGTSTAGMSTDSLATGSAIGNLLHGGNGFLGGLEGEVNPQIIGFINALAKALPSFEPFFVSATKSLSGFFGTVEQGLQSQGFRSFLQIMGKDVGPIMDDFGKFTSNAAGIVGGFLKLFGGAPAQAVGAWFDRVSGGLDSFLNKAKISPGFMDGMTQAFNFLGAAGDFVWHALDHVFQALAPIGLTMMKFLTPAIQGLTQMFDALPVNAITAAAVALGLVALTASPLLQVAAALLAVGWAFKELKAITGADYKPMTGADFKNAFAGELGGKTPADLAAAQHAQALGLTPQQVYKGYTYFNPTRTGSGLTSTADSVRLGANGKTTSGPAPAGTQGQSYGVFSKQNIQQTIRDGQQLVKDTSTWSHDIAHWFDLITSDIANFVTKSVPHAFSQLGGFFTSAFDKATNALDHGRHDIAHWFDVVTTDVANFVTKSIPHAFSNIGAFFTSAFDKATHGLDVGRHDIAAGFDRVTTDIANFVTRSVPHAFSGIKNAVLGAFSGAENWLAGIGGKIVAGLVHGINAAIGGVNSLDPSLPGILGGGKLFPTIPKIPGYSEGGPVPGAPGQAQLAIVHGGEYVLSQAMIARGGAGGPSVIIQVDARGSSDPAAVESSARRGVSASLPQITRAFKGSRAA